MDFFKNTRQMFILFYYQYQLGYKYQHTER